MKTIYISGKITGIEKEAPLLFEKAEKWCKQMGYKVVNPLKLNHNHNKSWQSYMRVCVKALCDCDEIYMIDNWINSEGAREERRIAEMLGMFIHEKPLIFQRG